MELFRLRKAKGISANQLAKMCGVTRQQICNIEKGRNGASIDLAKKLGNALGVSWTVFFDEGNGHQKEQS